MNLTARRIVRHPEAVHPRCILYIQLTPRSVARNCFPVNPFEPIDGRNGVVGVADGQTGFVSIRLQSFLECAVSSITVPLYVKTDRSRRTRDENGRVTITWFGDRRKQNKKVRKRLRETKRNRSTNGIRFRRGRDSIVPVVDGRFYF